MLSSPVEAAGYRLGGTRGMKSRMSWATSSYPLPL